MARSLMTVASVSLSLCLAAAIGNAGAAAASGDLQAGFEAAIARYRSAAPGEDRKVPPAMSVAICRDGEPVYAAGFGEAQRGEPARADTPYKIGSISKQFTAAALLKLMERNATFGAEAKPLRLDTPISEILPQAHNWATEGNPSITVRHLLTMTSGLPNFTRRPPQHLDPWGWVPASKLLQELASTRPGASPGSFEYSNTAYFLLSEIAQNVRVGAAPARTYEHVLTEDILAPAGLKDTMFVAPERTARLASPHYSRRPAFTQGDWLRGSADLTSTALDLCRWDARILGGQVLNPEFQDAMFSDAARVSVWTYYGMGWFLKHEDGADQFFHSGTVPGYTGQNLVIRKAGRLLSVSILTNQDGIQDLDELADTLAEIALAPR